MTELKPCPFCGYREYVVLEEEEGFFSAVCENCVSAACPAPTAEQAWKFWNKRSEPKESA